MSESTNMAIDARNKEVPTAERLKQMEDIYLDALWECYRTGVDNENMDPKILFCELVRDLIHQLEDRKKPKAQPTHNHP